MKERPILFSAPMVRALLDGSKTQTRRVLPSMVTLGRPEYPGKRDRHGYSRVNWLDTSEGIEAAVRECKYGQPGDRLWVREAHWMDQRDTTLAVMNVDGFVVAKNGRETGEESNPKELGLNHFWKLRPSIHMPRWASRITLEITGVRVEKLQEISETDAIAEGVNVHPDHHGKPRTSLYSPVQSYRDLWEQINGEGSWEANPWVWVLDFCLVKGGAA